MYIEYNTEDYFYCLHTLQSNLVISNSDKLSPLINLSNIWSILSSFQPNLSLITQILWYYKRKSLVLSISTHLGYSFDFTMTSFDCSFSYMLLLFLKSNVYIIYAFSFKYTFLFLIICNLYYGPILIYQGLINIKKKIIKF